MNEDQKADLLDRLIDNPPGREQILVEAGASPAEREELLTLAETADAAWLASRVPTPLDADPVAILLGVAPLSNVSIDPARFKAARTRSKVSVTQLRDRLVARGWGVTGPQIASWQTRVGLEVSSALLEDISTALGTTVDKLIAPSGQSAPGLHAILRSTDWFDSLVEQWQRARGVVRSVAEEQVLARATATVHRGEEPDVDQIHTLLQQLIMAGGERRRR